ncbi:ABC transporter ATP-binding protein [Clostridium hydrogenum]|uniref:ABC transporter ATP-binding protein n=1 Tax=Clostridium hydrogenum TaxID=2855764 RepID=UPI001F1B4492|nr:ABC transporter ATP-binding protein [Clostridium hydrogenum]
MFLQIKNINKSYGGGQSFIKVLNDASTDIEEGQMCSICGPSGSGKSTFLNVIGGIDTVDSGSILIDGKEIVKLSKKNRALYRRDYLGFIFQFYNLVSNLTVRENILVCEYLAKEKSLNVDELIELLGLKGHENKFPSQLSGGQQQRCAIARALIKNPKLLLCDEPTGALDSKTSGEILTLLENVNEKYGTTMLIVTHNEGINDMVHKVIRIKDGKIAKDYINEKRKHAAELDL